MDLPESPEARIRRELAPGEDLLWAGRPRQGLVLRRGDAFLIPFSLFWCGFIVFWEVMADRHGAPPLFKLFGLPFVLIGLYLLIGRFLVDAMQRKRRFYGVTSSRVLLASGRSVDSLDLRGLAQVSLTVRPDGSGDIAFGPGNPYENFVVAGWPGMAQFRRPSFEGIPRAREVHDLIRRAQGGTP